jgi:hypothetical protein
MDEKGNINRQQQQVLSYWQRGDNCIIGVFVGNDLEIVFDITPDNEYGFIVQSRMAGNNFQDAMELLPGKSANVHIGRELAGDLPAALEVEP